MGVESSVHPMVKAITLASLLDAESDKGNSVLKKEQVEFEGFRTSTAQIAWDFALPASPLNNNLLMLCPPRAETDSTRKELEQILKKISALQTELTVRPPQQSEMKEPVTHFSRVFLRSGSAQAERGVPCIFRRPGPDPR